MQLTAQQFLVVADIGGTHCRFAALRGNDHELNTVQQWQCSDFPDLLTALIHYIDSSAADCAGICLALPGPVHLDPVPLVNNPWRAVNVAQLYSHLKMPVWSLNDFSAQAHCLAELTEQDSLIWRAGGSDKPSHTQLIIGPGTGLGVGGLIGRQTVIDSEAGQMLLAAATDRQRSLLRKLAAHFPRVVNETVLSGPGLSNLHAALHDRPLGAARSISCADIIQSARTENAECMQTISEFARWLGSVCGDLALGLNGTGGVMLSGSLLLAMRDVFPVAEFLAAFDDKQSYAAMCKAIPVRQLLHPQPGLLGAARFARLQVQSFQISK